MPYGSQGRKPRGHEWRDGEGVERGAAERDELLHEAWSISGPAALSLASMLAGDMFLPAALMMISFLRSTICR